MSNYGLNLSCLFKSDISRTERNKTANLGLGKEVFFSQVSSFSDLRSSKHCSETTAPFSPSIGATVSGRQ
jgi:hypothetical protein